MQCKLYFKYLVEYVTTKHRMSSKHLATVTVHYYYYYFLIKLFKHRSKCYFV